jgi:hypothetical protein
MNNNKWPYSKCLISNHTIKPIREVLALLRMYKYVFQIIIYPISSFCTAKHDMAKRDIGKT